MTKYAFFVFSVWISDAKTNCNSDDKATTEISTHNGNVGNQIQSGSSPTAMTTTAAAVAAVETETAATTTTTATTTQQHTNPFIKSKFITSDNSFKFNFAVNCD